MRLANATTTYGARTALRPAIVNWQTDTADVDRLVQVTRELTAAAR